MYLIELCALYLCWFQTWRVPQVKSVPVHGEQRETEQRLRQATPGWLVAD